MHVKTNKVNHKFNGYTIACNTKSNNETNLRANKNNFQVTYVLSYKQHYIENTVKNNNNKTQ